MIRAINVYPANAMPIVSLLAPKVSLRYSGSSGTIRVKEKLSRKFPVHIFR